MCAVVWGSLCHLLHVIAPYSAPNFDRNYRLAPLTGIESYFERGEKVSRENREERDSAGIGTAWQVHSESLGYY
jgi:hypothetical protein